LRGARAAGAALAAAGFLFIVVATLTPVTAPAYPLPSTCIVCGQLGGVDVVNNVIMFVPFAAGLTLAGLRRWAVLALAIATTLTVETLQIGVIRGRDANVGDLLMNTVGGMVGIALTATWRRWLTPGPRAARRLARGWAIAWLAILAGTAWALQRNAPAGEYLGNMPPGDERYSVYRGQVVASTVGGRPIPTGPIADEAALRRLVLLDTLTVAARVTTGSMPQQVAAVALVTTPTGEELFALGQRKRDLVFRVRMNASAARLRTPSAVIPEGFPYVPVWAYGERAPKDTMEVAGGVRRDILFATATHARQTVRQEVALAPTLGWSFFLPFEYGFGAGTPWLTALWVGGLLVPVGYWRARAGRDGGDGGGSPRREWALLAGVVVIGLGVVPVVSRLHTARWWEWAAAIAGLAAGWLAQRVLAGARPARAR
jgi:hypothetical protein